MPIQPKCTYKVKLKGKMTIKEMFLRPMYIIYFFYIHLIFSIPSCKQLELLVQAECVRQRNEVAIILGIISLFFPGLLL